MLQKFQEHIDTVFPFLRKKRLLIACSGGVDSVVLAHLCRKSNLDIGLVHCNFQLRGKESDVDEAYVKELSKLLGVAFVSVQFDTMSEVNRKGGSVQMVARSLRYEWFEKTLKEKKRDYVLTAHHANDALETFLINLSRGTGIDGLSGIPEINGTILRPLLPFSRNEIISYANSEGLIWREDSSNMDSKYLRNKIRLEIVPKLKELHPTFLDNFLMTQKYTRQSKGVLDGAYDEVKKRIFCKQGKYIKISIADLKALHPMDAYLHGIFKNYGFTEWDDIKTLLDGMSGKEVHSPTHRLLKDRGNLLLQEIEKEANKDYYIGKEDECITVPIHLVLRSVSKIEKPDKCIVFLDKEKLNYPLRLRKWKKADYFYPLGMQGRKKLSKFFKDEKMDVFSKEDQWLLCSGNDIVWIIGKRADERFKVDGDTSQIVKITYSV